MPVLPSLRPPMSGSTNSGTTALPWCKFGYFGTYYFYVNRHYLVQFLITDLKENKRNNKKKSRQISSYLKNVN